MREIKFRGKRRGEKEYVYGSLVMSEGLPFIKRSDPDGSFSFSVEPSTVGQYTGMKDNEGTEIYEGDRLLMLSNHFNGHAVRRVVYHEASFILTADRDDATTEGCKRLGYYVPSELHVIE